MLAYLCYIVWLFLSLLQGVEGEYAYVTVDPSLQGQGQCSLPSTVKFSLETGSDTLTLNLVRNDHVHPSVPSYVIKIGEDGEYVFTLEEPTETKTQAAYQDLVHEAAVFVSCHFHSQKGAQLEMEGSLFVESVKYRILPSKSPVSFFRKLFHSEEEKLYHMVRAKESVPFDSGMEAGRHEEILGNTLEDIRLPSDHPSRVKRGTSTGQGPQPINIDVLLLLEYSVINEWSIREDSPAEGKTKAKEYFAHVVNAVNLRYQSIESDEYEYNIRLTGYIVSETSITSPWSEKNQELKNGIIQTNATQVLSDLQQWVNRSKGQLESYDHIMLFTGYDLVAEDSGFRFNYTTGFAYIAAMCDTDGYSISVVEDHGGFQSVGTAAHEIGHSLSAKHDGLNNDCRPEDRYVMAPVSYNETEANKYNPWFFSNCSVAYFVNFTNRAMADNAHRACLTESIKPTTDVPDVTNMMPGQLFGPDAQCQHQYGSKSYLCRGTGFDVGNILCRAMFCYLPDNDICVMMTAALGTTCGNKMWCINGDCEMSNDAPETNATCVHGDQPYVKSITGEKKCRATITEQPGLCYGADWLSICCDSCDAACQGPSECLCGDKRNACVESNCGVYNEETRAACCHTCRNFVPTTTSTTTTPSTTTQTTTITTTPLTYPSTCTDVSSFDGVTCAAYVKGRGRQVCYESHFNRSCCGTCSKEISTDIETCKWGDHSPASCYTLNSYGRGSICPKGVVMEKCCETCAKMEAALNLPTPAVNRTTTNIGIAISPSVSVFAFLVGIGIYFV